MLDESSAGRVNRWCSLVLEPAGNLWGSERVLLDFLAASIRSKWNIAVCCPPASPILGPLRETPWPVYPYFVADLHRRGIAARGVAALGFLIAAAKFKPNVIHVNQAGASKIALLTGRLIRRPVVAHVRILEEVDYLQQLGAAVNQLRRVICVSDSIRKLLASREFIKEDRLVTLIDPYEMKGITTIDEPEKICNIPTFSCVGRLCRSKGQDLLVAAVKILKDENKNVHVKFIGTAARGDDYGDSLRDQASELGISDRISWLGFQNNVLEHLSGCYAQVVPSRYETLGRAVFEAWDAGTFPIAYRGSGGPSETISASQGGVLYDSPTPESLARAMNQVLGLNLTNRNQLVERGYTWLKANTRPDSITERLHEIWHDAIVNP